MPINVKNKSLNKYKWTEEKTITVGNNSLTLDTLIEDSNKLLIIDRKYGAEWIENREWNRIGQVVTFTESSFIEDMTFIIICL